MHCLARILWQEANVAKALAQQRETEARAAHARELDKIKATEVRESGVVSCLGKMKPTVAGGLNQIRLKRSGEGGEQGESGAIELCCRE